MFIGYYINTISYETKKIEKTKSVIFNSFEKLVRILSYILIPLGVMLFLNQYVIIKSISNIIHFFINIISINNIIKKNLMWEKGPLEIGIGIVVVIFDFLFEINNIPIPYIE